jgi:hypothetical protein
MSNDYYIDKDDSIVIYGEGKGGGGHRPIEASDTLQSKQTVKLLFAISEGELALLTDSSGELIGDGLPDVYLNQIPFHKDGAYTTNFTGKIDYRAGTSDQIVIQGFVGSERGITTSFSNMKKDVANIINVEKEANSVRITLTVEALRHIEENGDMNGNTVSHSISVRPITAVTPNGTTSTGTWTTLPTVVKTGKASSPYSWDINVPAPPYSGILVSWQLRVIRISEDDSTVKSSTKCGWTVSTAIIDVAHTYPKTALISITLSDAGQFSGSIPEILFKPRGIKVPVLTLVSGNIVFPTAFSYSANPAYILLHVLTIGKDKGGLGILITDIDLVSVYNLAQYCDQKIDHTVDGVTASEPRYAMHNQFYTRENVPTFLMYILSICNANFTTNEFGQISLMFDHAGQAITKQVTNANVVAGKFSYSSNNLESRISLVNVTYNNDLYYGRTDTVTVEEETLTARYGLQTSDIVLPGCTSEAQAYRKARWAIYNSSRLTGFTNFSVFFAGMMYQVGELVRVYDNDNTQSMQAGLVISSAIVGSTTVITVDRLLTYVTGTKTFYTQSSIHGAISGIVSAWSTTAPYTVTITSEIFPEDGSPFNILADIQEGKIVKVIKIDKSGSEYIISCLDHLEAKYEYIDGTVAISIPSYDLANNKNYGSAPIDINSILIEPNFSSTATTSRSKLQISWVDPNTLFTSIYKLSWRRDNNNTVTIYNILENHYDIEDPIPGTYEITIAAINPVSSVASIGVTKTYAYRTTVSNSTLLPPKNFKIEGESVTSAADGIFSTPDLAVTFEYDTDNGNPTLVTDALKDYVVEVWSIATIPVLKGTFVVPVPTVLTGLNTFNFTFRDNWTTFNNATRRFTLKFYSRDILGDLSNPAIITVNNPSPAIQSATIDQTFNGVIVKVTTAVREADIVGFKVWAKPSEDWSAITETDVVELYDGTSLYINIPRTDTLTYYYKIAAYDSFGNTGLTLSSSYNQAALSTSIDSYTYTGLQFKPNYSSMTVAATNNIAWASFIATKNTTTSITVSAGSAIWSAGIMYLYYVPPTSGTTGTLSTTTTLQTAVTGRILGTYKGGTDITADAGKAFISGDQLLAGTIGANALVTNTAIITNAAQFGNILQSDNYSWGTGGTYSGWRIDKTGYAQLAGLTIRKANGDLVMSSGTGIEWSTGITGTGKAADNATVGATFGTNINGQITSANVSTYIANAAIGSAQIGSINLVGNFNVKSATAGARMEMDSQVIKVYDASGVLRVQLGNLSV